MIDDCSDLYPVYDDMTSSGLDVRMRKNSTTHLCSFGTRIPLRRVMYLVWKVRREPIRYLDDI